jgi:predicted small secreted protein
MRRIVIIAAFAASMFVTACNTMAGAGEDVSSAGHAVTHTAEDAKPK